MYGAIAKTTYTLQNVSEDTDLSRCSRWLEGKIINILCSNTMAVVFKILCNYINKCEEIHSTSYLFLIFLDQKYWLPSRMSSL